jgi:hypothetical protein
MAQQDLVEKPLLSLTPQWQQRLERVSAACFSSPPDFVRQAIEAEIVRRELFLERQGNLEPQWMTLMASVAGGPRSQ